MRRAHQPYGGARAFTATEFRQTTEEVAGADLLRGFTSDVSSTDELDYTDLVGFKYLITPPGRTREPLHRDDHDAGHWPPPFPSPSTSADVPGGAA
jgi:hypothetical protein